MYLRRARRTARHETVSPPVRQVRGDRAAAFGVLGGRKIDVPPLCGRAGGQEEKGRRSTRWRGARACSSSARPKTKPRSGAEARGRTTGHDATHSLLRHVREARAARAAVADRGALEVREHALAVDLVHDQRDVRAAVALACRRGETRRRASRQGSERRSKTTTTSVTAPP